MVQLLDSADVPPRNPFGPAGVEQGIGSKSVHNTDTTQSHSRVYRNTNIKVIRTYLTVDLNFDPIPMGKRGFFCTKFHTIFRNLVLEYRYAGVNQWRD